MLANTDNFFHNNPSNEIIKYLLQKYAGEEKYFTD